MANKTESTAAPTKAPASYSKTDVANIMANAAYKALTSNIPFYAFHGLKKRHMEALYAQGYYFYSQAKYKEALPLFKGLTVYNSVDKKGWLGAAGCYEMLKQYEHAIACYSVAAILDVNDPIPPLHALDCYIAAKNYPKALACLEAVILLSSKKREYANIKKRAEFLRDALQKTMTESKTA